MKIIINGEAFDYDREHRPMSEALAIEKAWGRRYAEWETELLAGSAEATGVLIWTIWRREGREVELQDLLDGKIDFDYIEVLRSMGDAAREAAKEEDPTTPAGPLTDPAGTATTPASTKHSSRKSST